MAQAPAPRMAQNWKEARRMSKATTAERAKNRRARHVLPPHQDALLVLSRAPAACVTLGVMVCAVINSVGATFLQRALRGHQLPRGSTGDWAAAVRRFRRLAATLGLHLRRRRALLAASGTAAMAMRHAGLAARSCAKRCSTACRTCRFATSTRTSAATS